MWCCAACAEALAWSTLLGWKLGVFAVAQPCSGAGIAWGAQQGSAGAPSSALVLQGLGPHGGLNTPRGQAGSSAWGPVVLTEHGRRLLEAGGWHGAAPQHPAAPSTSARPPWPRLPCGGGQQDENLHFSGISLHLVPTTLHGGGI